ncbi:MAG: aminoacyl-histidine dipeptidase [Lachnospiraceae bacterium]|nr:aminoacyl-histidine dipeptidase [Lachnospiraceae bacterium]
MAVLNQIQPEKVFHYFEEISGIPRVSLLTKEISDYLVSFARERNLDCRRDEAGNVIIRKDASAGYEAAEPVILQGHMDMVAVKEAGVEKNLLKEGLDLEVNGDSISAKGTSLGGDDGIALACALAILDDDSIPHPPLEVVFTTDEEIGMLGATMLDVSDLKGHILLNMDSEEEGVFTVSCAGGVTVLCHLPYETEELKSAALKVRISGLSGGHSGTEIHKKSANANILLSYLLSGLSEKVGIGLISMSGGEADNAIAASAEAHIALKEEDIAAAESFLRNVFAGRQEKYKATDPNMRLEITVGELRKRSVLTDSSTRKALLLLRFVPNGIDCRSRENPDIVQTSSNFGVLRTKEDSLELLISVRSSVEQEKKDLCARIRLAMESLGATVEFTGDYPGWEYRPESKLRNVMCGVYRQLFGREPRVEGVHAGLECGLFASKIPELDAVSFGPQINNIHSTREELIISSVQRFWELLLGTLRELR